MNLAVTQFSGCNYRDLYLKVHITKSIDAIAPKLLVQLNLNLLVQLHLNLLVQLHLNFYVHLHLNFWM